MILAGVLLKLGGYGFIRFSLPMFPEASAQLVWLIFGLSLVAIVYTSLVALVQRDMKKLIAYSSVAHMAFVTIGIFAFNRQGLEGAIIVMLSHGLVSGALFLCVGVVYDRLHTREIDRYGGLANNMPGYALLFMLFTMASVGLPGTSGFVGEFLALVGAYEANSVVAAVATTGIILGAAYMLWLYWRVVYGTSRNADAAAMPDLNRRELVSLGAIAAVVLWMGVYPESFMSTIRRDVGFLLARVERANPPGDWPSSTRALRRPSRPCLRPCSMPTRGGPRLYPGCQTDVKEAFYAPLLVLIGSGDTVDTGPFLRADEGRTARGSARVEAHRLPARPPHVRPAAPGSHPPRDAAGIRRGGGRRCPTASSRLPDGPRADLPGLEPMIGAAARFRCIRCWIEPASAWWKRERQHRLPAW